MKKTWPEEGARRTKTGFLWFPKSAKIPEGRYETRWLETASWEDEYFLAWWFCKRWVRVPKAKPDLGEQQ